MRRSRWRLKPWELLIVVATLAYLGLVLSLISGTSPGMDADVMKTHLACKNLAAATELYQDHSANPDHRLPSRVGDLIHPPWGGPSLYRDATEEPLDPWGNPFRMDHSRTPDGTDYILVWTAKPDGTRITQFGIGPRAEPKW